MSVYEMMRGREGERVGSSTGMIPGRLSSVDFSVIIILLMNFHVIFRDD